MFRLLFAFKTVVFYAVNLYGPVIAADPSGAELGIAGNIVFKSYFR
jgi:hypothetical protein